MKNHSIKIAIKKLLETQTQVSKFLFSKKPFWIFSIVISIAWIGIFIQSYQNGSLNWGEATHHTGEMAWNLIIFVIFISLAQKILIKIFPKITILSALLPLRKPAGIFMFLIAFSHTLSHFFKQGFLDVWQTLTSTDHAELFGAIALLLALPVFLTSTRWATKKMGFKTWKKVQKTTHGVFIFSAVHFILIDFFTQGEIEGGPILALLAYFSGYGYLYWHTKTSIKK